MKRILCYGDSNTWGAIPKWEEDGLPYARYDENTRWPMVAQKLLGEEYQIIEAGLGGRTTIYEPPGEPFKCAKRGIVSSLMAHRPLDMVVIMLGLNDLHLPFKLEESQLGDGIRELVRIIQNTPQCGRDDVAPQILIMAPAGMKQALPGGCESIYPQFYGDWGRYLSSKFPEVYEKVARECGCEFMDAGIYAEPGDGDGVHFTRDSHLYLGKAVAEKIGKL